MPQVDRSAQKAGQNHLKTGLAAVHRQGLDKRGVKPHPDDQVGEHSCRKVRIQCQALREFFVVFEDIVEFLAHQLELEMLGLRREEAAGLKHHNPASRVSMPGSSL